MEVVGISLHAQLHLPTAPSPVLFPVAAAAPPGAVTWRAGRSMGQDRTPMTSPPVPPDDRAGVLDDPRLTEMGLLMEVATSLTRLFGDQIAEHDLVPSEFEVLMRLARSPGGQLRMNDLARQIGLSSSGLTRLADRLEGRGLIERRPCPEDGRGSLAHVSDAGREHLLETLPGHLALIDRWYTGVLTPGQLDAVDDGLRAVRAVVHPDAEVGADDALGPSAD